MKVYMQIMDMGTRLNNQLFKINSLRFKINCNKVQKNRIFHNNQVVLAKLQLEDQGQQLQVKLVINLLQLCKVLKQFLFQL